MRSALDEDRDAGIVDSDDLIVVALDHFQAVASIPDEAVRRVVSLAMTTTTGCRKLYNQRALEQKLGIARTTLRRMLDVGLAHVALELDRMQDAKQAA